MEVVVLVTGLVVVVVTTGVVVDVVVDTTGARGLTGAGACTAGAGPGSVLMLLSSSSPA